MKKRILSLTLAALMGVTCLSGCGKKATDKTEDGKTILTVSGWPSKEDEEMKTMNALKDRFEEKNSDVSIKTDTWNFDVRTFYAKASGGELPNVYESPYTEVSKVLSGGYCSDLTEALTKTGALDQMDESVRDILSIDGKIYCVPETASVLGIVYNAEIFKQAGLMNADGTPDYPETWEELAKTSVIIKEKTGKSGIVLPTANKSGGWLFTNIAWSFGTEFVEKTEDGKYKATFDSEECKNALEFIKDLKWKYDILPADNLINGQDMLNNFGAGNSAMLLYSPSAAATYLYMYGFNAESFGSFPIPAGPVRRSGLLGGQVWYLADNSTDDQVDAGVRWLQFRGYSPEADADQAKSIEEDIKMQISNGCAVGIKDFSPWKADSPVVKAKNDLIDKYANINMNQVKPYNDSVADIAGSGIELHPEVEVCAQDLYGILDNCIQQVLGDKNADCGEILKKANQEFQTDFLDNLEY